MDHLKIVIDENLFTSQKYYSGVPTPKSTPKDMDSLINRIIK